VFDLKYSRKPFLGMNQERETPPQVTYQILLFIKIKKKKKKKTKMIQTLVEKLEHKDQNKPLYTFSDYASHLP